MGWILTCSELAWKAGGMLGGHRFGAFTMASVGKPECHQWDVGVYFEDVRGCHTKGTSDHLACKLLNLF